MNNITLTHFGDEIDLSRTYDQDHPCRRGDKPMGLWLSDESDFGWSEWNRQEEFVDTDAQTRTDFRIRDGAQVLHLDTPESLIQFTHEWGVAPEWASNAWLSSVWDIRWPEIATQYDGILITPYHWQHRLDFRWYYGWDVASACVWNLDALVKL